MWQDLLVYAIIVAAAAVILWKYYRKLTGKSAGCGGSCSCSGSCSTGGDRLSCTGAEGGFRLAPLSGSPGKRTK